MTTLSDQSTPVTDEARAKSVYVLAAVVAAIALFVLAAFVSNDARVGDGSTSHLSSYATGGSASDASASEYEAYQDQTQLGR